MAYRGKLIKVNYEEYIMCTFISYFTCHVKHCIHRMINNEK